ncbi:TPA: CDP-alcohol phosphatidyltransferase family protein [Streptococcus pneumoniae]|uniref:CDP-alcohol phosphatidyltransferase family protein n=1 Tax=Streptococcus pneumoniae TaxID=1313 RepID=UPI0005DCA9B8|nr:CDP-alcohol phosphatidyltransferase family protein [Streptococcus pneumoniae]CGG35010.1 WciO [Streptococcus pneumoniae]COS95276.1 WciO [Streptococcus pneumoniae]HEU6065817.1 CDP-alcohol phosphatidyltransferase family protein [Streptococcus pneumoniae]HEU6080171.1 CDP-alcohol phosphatidyltransferase family protein [Streptococcus pneumoniae]HEW2719012.1 CDP-alcohol phosphatidyltransferase family protein [Streptococcus pneumoniae]
MSIYRICKDIERKTMSPAKKAMAKNDYFAFYVGRPLSYILTVPFVKTNITPNQISYLSIIPLIVGFIIMIFTTDFVVLLLAWFLFFLWNLLDGVDGNLARYREQYSKDGSVVDAMAGYVAMVLTYFGAGIVAAHLNDSDIYIILGALSGISLIFPRLVMHKYINTVAQDESVSSIKDKSDFNTIKILALNMTSITGIPQVLLLLTILTNQWILFTLVYFTINFLLMIFSLYSLFKKENV